MKRHRPPKRGKPPQRDVEKTRAWERRSRKPIASESKKHRDRRSEREEVRRQVIDRDKGCRARGILPGRCGIVSMDRAPLEVHETVPRGRWAVSYLVPEVCVALCQIHHDYATEHPTEAEAVGLLAKAPQPGLTKPGRPS